MKNNTVVIVSDEQKEVLREMAAKYGGRKLKAFKENPEWAKILGNLKQHHFSYWISLFKKQAKAQNKTQRKTTVQRLPSQIEQNSLPSLKEPFHCVYCTKNLTNIINTILLEQNHKI